MMFFNILGKISQLYSPTQIFRPGGLCRINKSSVDGMINYGTQNDYNDAAINELEEEKFEEEDESEEEKELQNKQ